MSARQVELIDSETRQPILTMVLPWGKWVVHAGKNDLGQDEVRLTKWFNLSREEIAAGQDREGEG